MFYIYLTTNNINGKQYIGQHKGDPNDSYLGSGLGIMRAIKKYGKENFTKTILCYCDTREEADEQERYYIQKYDAVNSPHFYNAMEGGTNGDGWRALQRWNAEHPELAKQRFKEGGERLKQWSLEHPEQVKQNTKRLLDAAHEWSKNNPDKVKENLKRMNAARDKWREEHQQEYQEQVNRWRELGSITNSKKVLCITTGMVYDSVSEAARQTNAQQPNISKCLLGKRNSAGTDPITGKKLTWQYYEEDN